MTIVLISAFTGIVSDFVAKKASKDVIKMPSSSSTINDCANGSPRLPPPLSLSLCGCLTAITLLDVLVCVLLPVVLVLTVLASLLEIIASCVVSNKPFAS